jgi:hypothetical protein
VIPASTKPIKIVNFAGVADTGNASFTGVNDTDNACIAGAFASAFNPLEPVHTIFGISCSKKNRLVASFQALKSF